MYRTVSLTLAVLFVASLPVRAAETKSETPLSAAVARAAVDAAPALPSWAVDRPERRPGTLPALYATYAGLQVLDIYSTKRAIATGATEANPLMRQGGSVRTIAIKAAAGAGTIFFAERVWKKNRVGAIVLMAALNGVSAAVVAHNSRNINRR